MAAMSDESAVRFRLQRRTAPPDQEEIEKETCGSRGFSVKVEKAKAPHLGAKTLDAAS